MSKFFAALSLLVLVAFCSGCSEYTDIFVDSVTIIGSDDFDEDVYDNDILEGLADAIDEGIPDAALVGEWNLISPPEDIVYIFADDGGFTAVYDGEDSDEGIYNVSGSVLTIITADYTLVFTINVDGDTLTVSPDDEPDDIGIFERA
jgi:hypothetical protein